jgi:hypothetical protein
VPDDPRRGGPSSRGDQDPQHDQPTGRRRRSMEGSGGLSVSDLIEQHSRTNIPRPVPPGSPEEPTTGRRALPDAPATGRRALPDPQHPQQPPQHPQQPPRPGLDPRQQPPAAPRSAPGEQTGTRPRPPMADQARPQNFTGDQTGRRRRPDVPAEPASASRPPVAEQTGTRPRPTGEQTGTRPRPPQNGGYPPPGYYAGIQRGNNLYNTNR